MNFKVYFAAALIFLLFVPDLVSAQRQRPTTRRTTSTKKEDASLKDKLNIEIKLGNPNLSNNIFTLNLKSNIGYKITSWASAGAGIKPGFTYVNYPSGQADRSLFDFGAFGYARAKISRMIYLQGEYGVMSLANIAGPNSPRINFQTPLLGGGYMSPGEKWSYGAEVLFNLNQTARDQIGIVEYWISFSYKF
jgi:hypothetical protein